MNSDAVRAQIILDTLYPLMEDYTAALPGFGTGAVRVEVERENLSWPAHGGTAPLVLRFEDADRLGALLRGDLRSMPRVSWRPGGGVGGALAGITAGLMALAALPPLPRLSRRHGQLRARLLLNAASYAMESVARLDQDVHSIIQETHGHVLQIGVRPHGPFIHVVFNPGQITTGRGAHPSPHAEVVIQSLDVFDGLVSGKRDPLQAYTQKKIRIEGESVLTLMAGVLLQKVVEYF